MDKIGVSNYIANSLGEIILDVIDQIKIVGFVLTGGDTAKAVCNPYPSAWNEITERS
ncbi:hypothetical protein [Tepidibacillus marianensis]|uniref:hypothetical protein n=1 Tax=Tepidibacillus marianensis TaxID=3131995 RepID=UPI0030CB5F91